MMDFLDFESVNWFAYLNCIFKLALGHVGLG